MKDHHRNHAYKWALERDGPYFWVHLDENMDRWGWGGGVQWRTGKVKPQVFGGFKVDSFTNMVDRCIDTVHTIPSPFLFAKAFLFPIHFYVVWFKQSVLLCCFQKCFFISCVTDLICEPSHFLEINTEAALQNASSLCAKVSHSANIYYPSINTDKKECTVQEDEALFSCVGGRDHFRRLCPCRNYIPQQSALCVGCERWSCLRELWERWFILPAYQLWEIILPVWTLREIFFLPVWTIRDLILPVYNV